MIGAAVAVAVTSAVITHTAVAANTPTATSCEDIGNTEPAEDGFPERMSSLVGSDIRTGAHDCFERVVIEFGGSGELPGYWVRYESDPILQSPSGQPVDVAGDATLVVSVAAWMPDTEGNGYSGPTQIFPTNVTNIVELRQIENFEGMHQWAIGLDRERDFAVMTLTDPVRIVIDIALDQTAPPVTTAAPPVTTAAPPSTTAPATNITLEDHPLVGAWLLVGESDREGQTLLVAFTSDGIFQQADADGIDGYGTWEPTGPASAVLTAVQLIPDAAQNPAIVTTRASIEVAPDGQSFTADFTLELSDGDMPAGQYGPGSASATRIEVEPMGTPAGSLDEIFAEIGEGTMPAPTTPS